MYQVGTMRNVGALAAFIADNPGRTGAEIKAALGWNRRAAEERIRAALDLGAVVFTILPPEPRQGGRRKRAYFIGTLS